MSIAKNPVFTGFLAIQIKVIRWVATNVEGRLERILIKAGAKVSQGDLLLELSNQWFSSGGC
jgi:multidrug efflux pump subunit AcrA (membrane-fusion protein)